MIRFYSYLLAIVVGASGGVGVDRLLSDRALAAEKLAHALDNTRHAVALNDLTIAENAAKQRAIDMQRVVAGRIATLDARLTKEREAHEADNMRNRESIASGTRRLRVAVSKCREDGAGKTGGRTSASGVGDAAGATTELSPALGSALFAIADDADTDARAKTEYLQAYIRSLQRRGVVTGTSAAQTSD